MICGPNTTRANAPPCSNRSVPCSGRAPVEPPRRLKKRGLHADLQMSREAQGSKPMRLTAQGSKPMRLTPLRRTTALSWRCGGRPQVPLDQLEAPCCAEGGHHQLPFVCAWRERVGVGVSFRPQMDAVQSRKMADEECVWSLEGRVEKAKVSVIVPASLSGPPTAAEPTACRMDEWSF